MAPNLPSIKEILGSRPITVVGQGTSSKRIFQAYGQNNPDAILPDLTAIGTPHPTIANSFLLKNQVKQLKARDVLEITEVYEPPATKTGTTGNGETWQFDMSARNTLITSVEEASNQTVYNKDNLSGGTTHEVAIGLEGANVKGANVFRPFGALRVTKYLPVTTVDQAFRQQLNAAQNTINESSWQDWLAREVLFLGSTVGYDFSTNITTVNYNFLFGNRRTDVKVDVFQEAYITNDIVEVTLGTVDPFQIIHYKYEQINSLDTTNQVNVPTTYIIDAFKANVYSEYDFDLLNLVGPE